MTLVSLIFWIVVLGFIARAVLRWLDRRDGVEVSNANELNEMFSDMPGVRVMSGFPSWREDFRLPAPVNGGVSLVLPLSLTYSDVPEYFAVIRPILDHGYRIRLHRGHSPLIGEVGLIAQRAGAKVEVFHDAAREVEGMIIVPPGRPARVRG